MRLTGGQDRGRRLIAPKGARTRPTAAKVREAIFNILGPAPGSVLDLFAGTGALGLEALSRGATAAVFVERDSNALKALRSNLKETGYEDKATVLGGDVRSALRRLAAIIGEPGGPPPFSWVEPFRRTSARRKGSSESSVVRTCSARARSSSSSTTGATAPPSAPAACS